MFYTTRVDTHLLGCCCSNSAEQRRTAPNTVAYSMQGCQHAPQLRSLLDACAALLSQHHRRCRTQQDLHAHTQIKQHSLAGTPYALIDAQCLPATRNARAQMQAMQCNTAHAARCSIPAISNQQCPALDCCTEQTRHMHVRLQLRMHAVQALPRMLWLNRHSTDEPGRMQQQVHARVHTAAAALWPSRSATCEPWSF